MENTQDPLELIMLVDDDDTTNFVNKRLLNKMGIAKDIMIKKNGVEALEYLQEASQKDEVIFPDMIFLDLKMPVMDGFSFLDEYHSKNMAQHGSLIILMLTSSASFYDLEKLKTYEHVKEHYSKALTEADVRNIMKQYYSN